METTLMICDNQQEADAAKGFLQAAGATVRVESCTELSVHTVEGTPPKMTFPSAYHKMGNFILVTGKWK